MKKRTIRSVLSSTKQSSPKQSSTKRRRPDRLGALCIFIAAIATFVSCDSGNLLDLALSPPKPQTLDVTKVGVNDFFADRDFGSIDDQFTDIRDTLHLKFVRILIPWTDGVQPTPNSDLGYSFYDSIISRIPSGVDVVLVLAHVPTWMADSSNWTSAGNPRTTFVDRWVKPTIARYKDTPGIIGWEIWNEPDLTTVPADAALELTTPENYSEMLAYASNVVHDEHPGALVVMAATQSIQQNFPTNLNYNKRLKDIGVENFIDVWNVHYYGTGYESVVTSDGVADFLNGVTKTIWVTESGEQGPNNQLNYVETAWPFLLQKIPGIQRFYYYQYGASDPAAMNYGLHTTDPSFPVSDLYIYLRDHAS